MDSFLGESPPNGDAETDDGFQINSDQIESMEECVEHELNEKKELHFIHPFAHPKLNPNILFRRIRLHWIKWKIYSNKVLK